MISLLAPGPAETRLLQEIVAPLAVKTGTYTPDTDAPALAIIWAGPQVSADSIAALSRAAGRIIMILPADAADDQAKARAADEGADAIFVTPFRPGQITDRARTFLNRAAQRDLPPSLPLGPYDFLPRDGHVLDKKTQQKLKLTDKERDILLTLIGAGGQPVTRQALLDEVWAYAPGVETHTLETHIYRLRQKIEADPADPRIVLTDDAGYKILTR